MVPGKEKKPPFQGCELAAPQVALVCLGAVIIEVAGLAFRCRLDGDDLSRVDCVQRPGDDLLGLVRVLGADLPEFGYVQQLQRGASQRCADTDRAVVPEGKLTGAPGLCRDHPFHTVREVVIGILDLVVEEDLRIVAGMRDDACTDVRREETVVEVEDADVGGDAVLPGFQDQVEVPEAVVEVILDVVGPEQAPVAGGVYDVIEVAETPLPVAQAVE